MAARSGHTGRDAIITEILRSVMVAYASHEGHKAAGFRARWEDTYARIAAALARGVYRGQSQTGDPKGNFVVEWIERGRGRYSCASAKGTAYTENQRLTRPCLRPGLAPTRYATLQAEGCHRGDVVGARRIAIATLGYDVGARVRECRSCPRRATTRRGLVRQPSGVTAIHERLEALLPGTTEDPRTDSRARRHHPDRREGSRGREGQGRISAAHGRDPRGAGRRAPPRGRQEKERTWAPINS
jgi:hypothetical protein